MSTSPITVHEVERLLVEEAAMLDEWRLDDWLALIEDGGRYLVPPLDAPDAEPQDTLFLVADDYPTLRSRVHQLNGKTAWAENPRSRTRRIVGNVRILAQDAGEARITANFAVWRFQHGDTDCYVGRYLHRIVRAADGGLRIRERRAILDLETLRPHGKLSFIL